jgi:hypothetical protein
MNEMKNLKTLENKLFRGWPLCVLNDTEIFGAKPRACCLQTPAARERDTVSHFHRPKTLKGEVFGTVDFARYYPCY